jgi:hypothetical protein
LQEAALVAEELEQADIVPLLSGKSFEDDPHDRGTKSSLRIQVSAKALAAERDLFESLNFRSEVHCAQQPLPLGMKMIAFCLPALLSAGCLVFLAGAGRFRNQGFVRKLRDWKRWFLFGWIIWAAAVLFVVRLAGA